MVKYRKFRNTIIKFMLILYGGKHHLWGKINKLRNISWNEFLQHESVVFCFDTSTRKYIKDLIYELDHKAINEKEAIYYFRKYMKST